ncbi:MAG: hypothetical protein HZB55_22005 [Deltaproteobacteria bacterium]|nr:hypothetical protein [Deltaproteobacteria bacterium]
MGSVHPKKVAAAMAAVLQCIAETEAVLPSSAGAASSRQGPGLPCALPPLWGWAGRQDAMRDRVLLQRRLSKSW